MNSMTGFGSARASLGRLEVTVQVSSVNRKTLDLAIALPEEWRPIESEIAERVRQKSSRGRISVIVKAGMPGDSGGATIDADFVTKSVAELARIAGTQSVEFKATPELLWSIAASQRGRIDLPDAETAGPIVLSATGEALVGFFAMRAKEGTALQADLVARIDALAKGVAEIAAAVPRVVPAYRELLTARLRQAGLELELSDERVLKEVAIFADRCDVSEELTRLQSHLSQLRALLGEDGAVGRKAEFIMQEVGRELNTIGSKSNDLAIARLVIEGKNEAERIREQLANVE
jgi:uncharacterized protein (TIGR00255 family)